MSAKILIVGDSGTDQLAIKNMLIGYDVLFAGDGVGAWKCLKLILILI